MGQATAHVTATRTAPAQHCQYLHLELFPAADASELESDQFTRILQNGSTVTLSLVLATDPCQRLRAAITSLTAYHCPGDSFGHNHLSWPKCCLSTDKFIDCSSSTDYFINCCLSTDHFLIGVCVLDTDYILTRVCHTCCGDELTQSVQINGLCGHRRGQVSCVATGGDK